MSDGESGVSLNRDSELSRLRAREQPWDLVVIGGGATGVGVAMDAAQRGLQVLLVERFDFGKGTSSRSTKLVHGGVRYLKQGNLTLVRDALHERSLLRRNAPHLVQDTAFLIPCGGVWEWLFYGIGLKLYDLLAGSKSFARSRWLSGSAAAQLAPAIVRERMPYAVEYHDGQFDDTRLLINMVQTAHQQGACVVNYVRATGLIKSDGGQVTGVRLADDLTSETFDVSARVVVNAAGPFCDSVREMDQPSSEPMIAASQGVHVVLPAEFFPGDTAMIVPKTSDGRVIFIIPWRGHALVGTTDTAIPEATAEPTATPQEIDFLLETAARYLSKTPTRADVQSVFVGIRPLVKGDTSSNTASLSRDHVIRVSDSGLVTITGGKWTTVRKMAEDCVDRVIDVAGLGPRRCGTRQLAIHGSPDGNKHAADGRRYYGSDEAGLEALERTRPELAKPIHTEVGVTKSEVVWAVRHEMACTVEDVLARRTRVLFLNVQAALEMSAEVAALMAEELGKDKRWCEEQCTAFEAVAKHYLPPGAKEE